MSDYSVIGPIVKRDYRLDANRVDRRGKVFKVDTNKGVFALKLVEESSRYRYEFTDFYNQLYHKGYHHLVTIIPTSRNEWFATGNDAYYYLMPWIDSLNDRNANFKNKMAQTIGRMHGLTEQKVEINSEETEKEYESLLNDLDSQQQKLEQFVEQCERATYMSPFQLAFSSYFFEIMQFHQYSKRKLEEWKNSVIDEKKSRTSLVHGNVIDEHFLLDEHNKGWFINFEKGKRTTPIYDLATYIQSKCKGVTPPDMDQLTNWLTAYEKSNSLSVGERAYLLSHLTKCTPVYRLLTKEDRDPHREIEKVRSLHKTYRYLQHAHRFAEKAEIAKTEENDESHID